MQSASAYTRDPVRLTDASAWDRYWEHTALPVEVSRSTGPGVQPILDSFDRFLASEVPLEVLDVGGAPGRYAAYLWRRFGHRVCVLDSSPRGIALTVRNFALLGIPGEVMFGDVLAPKDPPRRFDVVYSLGLIEHFDDPEPIVAAHLEYLKPGGLLLLGCPNFGGLNLWLVRRLVPSVLSWHNTGAMNLRTWGEVARRLDLEPLFGAYLGGFQASAFRHAESTSVAIRLLRRALRSIARLEATRPGIFQRLNSPLWSYYIVAVYRKPARSGH